MAVVGNGDGHLPIGGIQLNAFQKIQANAFTTLLCVAGVDAKYFTDADNWVKLRVVPGPLAKPVEDVDGTLLEVDSRDFQFKACDLVIDGQQITPEREHWLTLEVGDQLHTYRVRRGDGGDQVFRYADNGLTFIRVHTVLDVQGDR